MVGGVLVVILQFGFDFAVEGFKKLHKKNKMVKELKNSGE
jgi:hypothetical protein